MPYDMFGLYFCHESPQSCYGVLHCALDESKVAALADTRSENDLTLPSKSRCYMEYDAVVVRKMTLFLI